MDHGQIVRRTSRTEQGPTGTMVNAQTGQTVHQGPLSAVTRPAEVRHCRNCGEVEIEGILALATNDGCPQCGTPWKE